MTVKVLTRMVPVSPPDYLEWFNLSSRPLIELSLKDERPAFNPRIEWIGQAPNAFMVGEPRLVPRLLSNWTQILRQPFAPDETKRETFAQAAKRAGEKILDDVELVLWYGKPSFDVSGSHTVTTCGGVLHYLRRRVYENDMVRLRGLSKLMLRDFRDFTGAAEGEWLWEFSLEVIRGRYERGMSPVCLPPTPRPVKPHAQGACLDDKELIA